MHNRLFVAHCARYVVCTGMDHCDWVLHHCYSLTFNNKTRSASFQAMHSETIVSASFFLDGSLIREAQVGIRGSLFARINTSRGEKRESRVDTCSVLSTGEEQNSPRVA